MNEVPIDHHATEGVCEDDGNHAGEHVPPGHPRLVPRSCPSCHSILNDPRGCADSWHQGTPEPLDASCYTASSEGPRSWSEVPPITIRVPDGAPLRSAIRVASALQATLQAALAVRQGQRAEARAALIEAGTLSLRITRLISESLKALDEASLRIPANKNQAPE